jgi:transcription elongation factor Elf1
MTVLVKCKAQSVKQKKLGGMLIKVFDPEFEYDDKDTEISSVVRGARNLSTYCKLNMDEISQEEVNQRFGTYVIPLLDDNYFVNIILAMKDIIEKSAIEDHTKVELINGMSKADILARNEFVISEFLAGIYLYIVQKTDNRNMEEAVKEITDDYIRGFSDRRHEIQLIKSYYLDSVDSLGNIITNVQAMNLLGEVEGHCPVCGKNLTVDNVVHISANNEIDFVVCSACAPKYNNMSEQQLADAIKLKEHTKRNYLMRDAVANNQIAGDIRSVIRKVNTLDAESETKPLMEPLMVKEKVSEKLLQRRIISDVNDYYAEVNEIIESETNANRLNGRRFRKIIKRMYEDACEQEGASQSDIYNTMVTVLYEQMGRECLEACQVVVSCFVQNCEVFSEITG